MPYSRNKPSSSKMVQHEEYDNYEEGDGAGSSECGHDIQNPYGQRKGQEELTTAAADGDHSTPGVFYTTAPQSEQQFIVQSFPGDQGEMVSIQHPSYFPSSSAEARQKPRPPVYDVSKRVKYFWEQKKKQMRIADLQSIRNRCRHMHLPMARVKKIMKIDENVSKLMVASDAPVFLSAAAELFIEEVTLLSWAVVDEGKRKTMQKSDVSTALRRNEQFDFLIDVVPRPPKKPMENANHGRGSTSALPVNTLQSADNQDIQYVIADSVTLGNNEVIQLEDGQLLQATQIGQPIPIAADGTPMSQLPAGVQIVQVAPDAIMRKKRRK